MASKKPRIPKERLRDVGRELPAAKDFADHLEQIETMTAAAAALSTAALLDALLERAIALNLLFHDAKHYEQLFLGSAAPFQSFSSKILVAAALGIFNPDQRLAAEGVRTIRNAFAHAVKILDFETAAIAAECRKLNPQALTAERYAPDEDTPRERFHVTAHLLGRQLIQNMSRTFALRSSATAQPPQSENTI